MSKDDHLVFWDSYHNRQRLSADLVNPSDFARHAEPLIPRGAAILELGCGAGNDAAFFAGLGHPTTACDFSRVVVEQNSQAYRADGLSFMQVDVTHPLPFPNQHFDVVYARLSLHYFAKDVTRAAFSEIARVLRPGGQFFFMCKSTADPLYGEGKEIDPHVFVDNGHIRHFFDDGYVSELLDSTGRLKLINATHAKGGDLYGKPSAFLTVYARG